MPGDRTVLVHDYLLVMRGAERTFAEMAACWPGAPVATLLVDEEVARRRFAGRRVVASGLQRLRPSQSWFRALLPVLPAAAERLRLPPADLVVSSSSAFAHGVRPPDGVAHVCYCHSPFRYAWHERARALAEVPAPVRPLLDRVLERIRRWDLRASRRVTAYIANGRITQQRIGDFWGRDATVVHPPVDVERFAPGTPEDFFLVVGEVVRHKRTEAAVHAALRSGMPLRVAGTGPELARLQALYGDRVAFLGRVDDGALADLYARARAVVVPNVEEFGIVAVEAQAAGRPVLAAGAGGALETVVDGRTGVLVPPGDEDALAEAMREVDFAAFAPEAAVANAARFSAARFRARLRAEVERLRAAPA
jgi:glycosyltransferase involved in cell wall biosynthesis